MAHNFFEHCNLNSLFFSSSSRRRPRSSNKKKEYANKHHWATPRDAAEGILFLYILIEFFKNLTGRNMNQAFRFSSSDNLGNVINKSLDLIQDMFKNDANAEVSSVPKKKKI